MVYCSLTVLRLCNQTDVLGFNEAGEDFECFSIKKSEILNRSQQMVNPSNSDYVGYLVHTFRCINCYLVQICTVKPDDL